MIYDKGISLGEVWHCPFSPEWVEYMKRAVKVCESLTANHIDAAINRKELNSYTVQPGHFLEEKQDARGLPMSWCEQEKKHYKKYPPCCTAIYDYDSIPDIVATNGDDDWPLVFRFKAVTA